MDMDVSGCAISAEPHNSAQGSQGQLDSTGDCSTYVMILHTIASCDSVSTLYLKGKCKVSNLLHNDNNL